LSAILLDTSYLISLADPSRQHHQAALAYLREAVRREVPLYLSVVVAAEFQVKQAVTDLPMRNLEVLPFNFDHAMMAGLLMRELKRDSDDDRSAVKDDVKLIAQAICESLTHILTEDAQTLVKYVRRFNDAGKCALKTILLAEGFDAAWFNNGQRGLPGT
jgi:predicted nucleic acid-binding protein